MKKYAGWEKMVEHSAQRIEISPGTNHSFKNHKIGAFNFNEFKNPC